jgi:KaiC/GvpD/RAD55 family RecA-like ATPase
MAEAKDFIYSEIAQRITSDLELRDSILASRVKRIPTAIADLDTIVNGGFPAGSTILLAGEAGAGQQEYVYTSAAKLSIVRESPHLRHYFLGHACEGSEMPSGVRYVTFARSKEDILMELKASFNREFYEAIRDHTVFKDLSAHYFRHTIVPPSWTYQEPTLDLTQRSLLEALVEFLEVEAQGNMVIIDSITDLLEVEAVELKDLVATVKGIQRASKRWDGLVYLLLNRGTLERKHEVMFFNSVDGVLTFEWKAFRTSSTRQRYMYLEKFTSVLPHLALRKIAKFPTMVTSSQGLVVVYMERIS